MQANATTRQTDIFSTERAGLLEKLGALAGMSTWREPGAGYTNKAGQVPYAHILSAALVWWAGQDGYDTISGHILASLVLMRLPDGRAYDDTLSAMVRALTDISSRLARLDRRVLRHGCKQVWMQCAIGTHAKRPSGIGARDWIAVDALGTRTLWCSADQGLSRMADALRG
jgi:hypothetical protein